MPSEPLYFFEQTDFTLRLAHCSDSERPLRIDDLREVPLDAANTLVSTVPAKALVACAMRPKSRTLQLATPDEATKYAGFPGIQTFVAAAGTVKWFSAIQARDGGAPTNLPWLVATATEDHPYSVGPLATLTLKPTRCVSAIIATAGALARTANAPVLLLDIGELASHALVVTRDGVSAAGPVSADMSRIGEAVQNELGLKFRGSALKLFFNPDYDFSEVGAKIVGRLLPAIKAEIAGILKGSPAPTAIFVAGLPTNVQWFGQELAAALGLTPYQPDFRAWSTVTGITFSARATLSPAFIGVVDFLYASTLSKSTHHAAWAAEWISVATGVPAAAKTDSAAVTAPAPVAQPSTPPAPTPTPAATIPPQPTAAASAHKIEPPAKAPAPKSTSSTTSGPHVFSLEPTAPAKSAPPAKQTVPAKPAAPVKVEKPAPPKAPRPVVAKEIAPVAPSNPPARRYNLVKLIAVLALLFVVIGGAVFYFISQREAAAQRELEKHQTELRLKSEAEKTRLAELKAREEAESRKRIEAERAQKLSEAEAARQAEADAQAQAAARLANARGTLIVNTSPAGATITVGDLPPRSSPATFSDLKIGTYPVTAALPGHETVKLDLEVKENAKTEPPTLTLAALVGSLQIMSEPGSAHYELHPANVLMVPPESRLTGETPTTLENLNTGDYTVTLTRDGWAPHSQIVSIARNTTTFLRWAWPNSVVKITSTIPGATVTRGGSNLGVTPLTLSDQTPGDVVYEVALDRYDPVVLSGRIEGGKTLDLTARFNPEDEVFAASEVDRKPEAIGVKQPELPYYLTLENSRAEIELTVGKDGTARNVRLVQTSNPEVGKFCQSAIAKWQFKPGVKKGSPVNVRLNLPFNFRAVKR